MISLYPILVIGQKIINSTISKKLASGENIVKAKGTEYIFYIMKIN